MTFHCSVKSNIEFSPKSQPRHVRYCTTNPTMPCFPFYSWHLQISVYAKLQLSAETLAIDWLNQNASDVRIVNKSHFRHVSSDTTFPRMQWKLSGEHELVVLRKRWKHATEQRFLKEQINKKKKERKVALLYPRLFCVLTAMHFGILSPENISVLWIHWYTGFSFPFEKQLYS